MKLTSALLLVSGLVQAATVPRTYQPRTLIDPAFWPVLVRYTNIQSASVYRPCNLPPYNLKVVKYIANNFTDTQATIFQDDEAKEFIVTFPGTNSTEDILFDVNIELLPFIAKGIDLLGSCLGCAVHAGFLAVWNSVADDIVSTLQASLALQPTYKVTLTGHSLGSGIGSLAYPALKGVGLPVTKFFSFGGPRAGNIFFANYVDSLAQEKEIFRVTHAYDIIPRILLNAIGYQHHSVEYYEQNITAAEELPTAANATFRCYGQEPPDCINSLGLQFTTGLAHGYYTNVNLGLNPNVCDKVFP